MHKRDRIFWMSAGPGGPPGPPWMLRMHGHGPGPGPGGGFGRGRRMRRGNVRAAILLLLEDEARNGYQLMQELEERSGGAWRPSPGAVYPALQLLADEGLIRSQARETGNVYELTDAGRKHLDEHREALGAPWEQAGEGIPEGARELMGLAMQVGIATRQVVHAGSAAQAKRAAEILADTRRALYGILAEDESK